MKIVINTCFGGFGLSQEAMTRYAEIKGITIYPVRDERYSALNIVTYYTVPESERMGDAIWNEWKSLPQAERIALNKKYSEQTLCDRDIKRDDPALIQTVEELGEKSSGEHAKLKIVEIPDGVAWEIEEYDGNEHIAECHRTWR
jgi:hypothetical protein